MGWCTPLGLFTEENLQACVSKIVNSTNAEKDVTQKKTKWSVNTVNGKCVTTLHDKDFYYPVPRKNLRESFPKCGED